MIYGGRQEKVTLIKCGFGVLLSALSQPIAFLGTGVSALWLILKS